MRHHIQYLFFGFIAAALTAHCGNEDNSSYLDRFSCDPFELTEEPIQLISILAVGQDDAETIHTDAQAFFSWENTGWGKEYLKIGEEEIALTRLEPESEDMGQFSFYCFQ